MSLFIYFSFCETYSTLSRGSGVFLFALVLTEGNSLEQNKRALSYEQLNTPFALSSLVLNVEISCNRFHDFILSLHFS